MATTSWPKLSSQPNANCQYTRQPVRSVAQMHLNVKGLEPNWCQICLKVRAALHQVEDKPACLTRLFLRICFWIWIWICDLWVISECALSMLRVALGYIDHVVVIWIKVWYSFSLCPQILSETRKTEENCLLCGRVNSYYSSSWSDRC